MDVKIYRFTDKPAEKQNLEQNCTKTTEQNVISPGGEEETEKRKNLFIFHLYIASECFFCLNVIMCFSSVCQGFHLTVIYRSNPHD